MQEAELQMISKRLKSVVNKIEWREDAIKISQEKLERLKRERAELEEKLVERDKEKRERLQKYQV
jgi:hypothetical protein